jgi:2-(3-amino-3-carboxypropyl)histidine synthase
VIDQLPQKLIVALPVQFIDSKEPIKNQLEEAGKIVSFLESKHGIYPGQILGCDIAKVKKDFDAFLYIGDGLFHPTALLYEHEKLVFCYNPFDNALNILDNHYREAIQKRRKGQLVKFYSSQNIGILVSTKPGQNNLSRAKKLKDILTKEGKNAYIFIADTIQPQQLNDFNFIDCWINTACPRIAEDINVLNMADVPLLNNQLFYANSTKHS